MQFSAQQISSLINGKVVGDPSTVVSGFAKIEEAGPETISFLANPKYEAFIYNTRAGIVIVNEDLNLKAPVQSTLIRVKDAYTAFATLMEHYQKILAEEQQGIEDPVFIHPTAQVGKNVFIGAFAYIGENAVVEEGSKICAQVYIGKNAKVGKNTVVHPGVKIYEDCVVGNRVIIHAGAVIGSDGFGFAPLEDGSYKKIPQMGNVVIGDHVEIGANTCIDRATMGSTLIQNGSKLDNLIQVAHNVVIGEHTAIAAQTGISGSAKIGNRVMMGGQVGVNGHITVADGTKVTGQSGITKSIPEKDTVVAGTPATNYKSSMKSLAIYRNLPKLEKKIKELEFHLQELIKERDSLTAS